MKTIQRLRGRQTGMTLIEVLVSLLIFSLGVVGLIGLQARAMQFSNSAEDTSRAALLASEIAATIVMSTTPGTNVDVPAATLQGWRTRAADSTRGGLPNGTVAVAASGNSAAITITWQPPSAASGAANAVNQYVTDVVIPPQ